MTTNLPTVEHPVSEPPTERVRWSEDNPALPLAISWGNPETVGDAEQAILAAVAQIMADRVQARTRKRNPLGELDWDRLKRWTDDLETWAVSVLAGHRPGAYTITANAPWALLNTPSTQAFAKIVYLAEAIQVAQYAASAKIGRERFAYLP